MFEAIGAKYFIEGEHIHYNMRVVQLGYFDAIKYGVLPSTDYADTRIYDKCQLCGHLEKIKL